MLLLIFAAGGEFDADPSPGRTYIVPARHELTVDAQDEDLIVDARHTEFIVPEDL